MKSQVCGLRDYYTLSHGSQIFCFILASFPGLLSPNALEGLVKLVRRMTSVDVWRRGLSRRARGCSLVPRPSPAPVFDRLQYAKTEPEGPEEGGRDHVIATTN